MRKMFTMLAVALFVMIFLPVSTYAAPLHTTKHTTHKVVHTTKKTKKAKQTKKTTKKTAKKTTKTTKKQQKITDVSVQGTSPYVIVGTMEPTKEFTWADLMKQGPNWLNYTLSNSKTTWHDPAKY